MIILGFDTSTPQCSVALSDGDTVIMRQQAADRKHTECLLPLINECLEAMQIKLADINLIAFGQGPGSFMGVRLAATVAKGLGYAVDCPLVPVSTLQTLAQTAYRHFAFSEVVAGWDARMQELYYGCYALGQDKLMVESHADALVAPADLMLLDSMQHWPRVGNAWEAYKIGANSYPLYPEASDLLLLAANKYRAGASISALEAKPIYLRGI